MDLYLVGARVKIERANDPSLVQRLSDCISGKAMQEHEKGK